MMRKICVSLFFSMIFITMSYAQNPASWVTVSNDLIRVSLDPATGRYIISDVGARYQSNQYTLKDIPNYLPTATPLTNNFILRSSVLGSMPHAANTALFDINGALVAFGSAPGQWVSAPIASQENGEIIYSWRLGGFEIVQVLTIVSNRETLLQDAVSVTYQIQNNSRSTLNAGIKMVLDPSPGDGQDIPFRLPEGVNITQETRFTRANMPEYWLSTDQQGSLSSNTVRGLLRGTGVTRPDSLIFTTLENALKARWEHYLNTSLPLVSNDTAVVLVYNPAEVLPGNTRTVSTIVGISGVMNNENNGLKVNASVFMAQESNPARLGFWIINTSSSPFDYINLELSIPATLQMISEKVRVMSSLNPGEERYVEWLVSNPSDDAGTFRISLSAQGIRGGVEDAALRMPFTVRWGSNTRSSENDTLQQAVEEAVSIQDALPKVAEKGAFQMEDTLGPTSESLSKLRDYLANSRIDNVEEIIKLIDTEQQLIKEIIENERNLAEIDQQYTILRRVYRKMYETKPVEDKDGIPLQQLQDKLLNDERKLREQERNLDSVLKSTSPYSVICTRYKKLPSMH
ncbi:MAG: hypothetical protein ACRCY4_03650 [Brevinema sp.]